MQVFLKEHTVEALQTLAKKCAAVVLQSFARGRIARSRLEKVKADQLKDSSVLTTSNDNGIIASDQRQRNTVFTSGQQPCITVDDACDRQKPNTVFTSNIRPHDTLVASDQQRNNIEFTSDQKLRKTVVATAIVNNFLHVAIFKEAVLMSV